MNESKAERNCPVFNLFLLVGGFSAAGFALGSLLAGQSAAEAWVPTLDDFALAFALVTLLLMGFGLLTGRLAFEKDDDFGI